MKKESITVSDWISFLIFRIEEIQADSRTIYSSTWQKFSLSFTFIFAFISIALAAGAVVGIKAVVDFLRDMFTDRGIIGSIALLFIVSIVYPFIVGFINNKKQREHLKDYEDVLGKIYFENLKDEEAILKSIKEIEEKHSSDLTSYIKTKLKRIWSDYWHSSKIVKGNNMKTKKRKNKSFELTFLSIISFITLVVLFLILLYQENYIWIFNKIEVLLIINGFASVLFCLLIVEILRELYRRNKLHHFLNNLKNTKIFEFIFFLSLFFATLCATLIASNISLLTDYWWFTISYGVAIASGIYHYIVKLDCS